MKASAHLELPNVTPLTVTITGTMEEWRRLCEQLDTNKWPSWQFADSLGKVIRCFETRVDSAFEAGNE